MPALAWANHHRLLAVSVGLTLVIVAIAAGFWLFVLRTTGTPVDLGQALRLYRQGQPRGMRGDDSQLPAPGVYRYRTIGGEKLSVGGISRTFPSSTPMIVTDSTCSTMTWEPLVQHTEGLVECRLPDSAVSIASMPSSEDIAGVQTSSNVQCPSDTYLVPPHARRGQKWSATCHSDNERVTISGQFVGPSSVVIGGHSVPAFQTQLTLTFAGAEFGANPNDYWIDMSDGMILRQREVVSLTQPTGPLGSVHYSESLSITLQSLTPAR